MAPRAGPSRNRADLPYVTLDQVLEPYKSKDKTVPDKIFAKTKEDAEASNLITIFGMRDIDDDGGEHGANGQDDAARRGHTEPPDGSPPTPPRSPSASALDKAEAHGTHVALRNAKGHARANDAGRQAGSGRETIPSAPRPSLVSQERALPPSTMSFPEPGQVMRTLPTPAARDDPDLPERMRNANDGDDDAEAGVDWEQGAHGEQPVNRQSGAQEIRQPEGEEDDTDALLAKVSRKIRDPLAFSDHVPSQTSSQHGHTAPIGNGNTGDDSDDAMKPVEAVSASRDDEDEDENDDGLSEYERTHRAPARDHDSDRESSANDAEDVERQSSPVQPVWPRPKTESGESAQDRSFSASQKSTQDRSLSRYSRAPGDTNAVLVDNSDETKVKPTPDGLSTTPPDSPPRSVRRGGDVPKKRRYTDSGEGQGFSAQQSGSSPTSSGALAYLNPMNVVRAVTRVVKGSTHARSVGTGGEDNAEGGIPRDVEVEANEDEIEVEDEAGVENMDGESGHDPRPRAAPVTPAHNKQSQSSPMKKREPADHPAQDAGDADEERDGGSYDWPDNFPPPPSPDLLPARYRAASERTDTPGIKSEFSPAIKREPGTARIFSPVFVNREAKAEYHTPGPAARAAKKTTRGSLRRKRMREEMAAAAEVEELEMDVEADLGERQRRISDRKAEEEPAEGEAEPEPESDPRRFDRECKRRRISPTLWRDQQSLPTLGDIGDVEMEASEEVGEGFQRLASGVRLPLLGGFVPDFNISYGVNEDFMAGVREAIDGLRRKASRKARMS